MKKSNLKNYLNAHFHYRYDRKQLGVTLVELMVAMAVSSIVMLGISNIYLTTKKSAVVHDEFSRIQENGRYTLEALSSNIRNAGFFGCASGLGGGSITNGLNQSTTVPWNFETGLMGFEAVGTDIGNAATIDTTLTNAGQADWATAAGMTSNGAPLVATVPANILARAIAGSDILIMRTTDGTGARIAQNNNGAQVFVDDVTGGADANGCISGICQNDILLVSDCTSSRIFQATNIQSVAGGAPGGCGTPLPCFNLAHAAVGNPGNAAPVTWQAGVVFGRDAEIMRVVTKFYFVGLPLDGAGAPIPGSEPSLFEQINTAAPQPLVEGIENIQALYGVDTNGDGVVNRYFSADDVPDVDGDTDSVFDGVLSVKLSFLVRTPQNMPGINRTPADYFNLTYAMGSPASPITIDPIPIPDATATDRRMRKVYNVTVKIRNKSFNIAN